MGAVFQSNVFYSSLVERRPSSVNLAAAMVGLAIKMEGLVQKGMGQADLTNLNDHSLAPVCLQLQAPHYFSIFLGLQRIW